MKTKKGHTNYSTKISKATKSILNLYISKEETSMIIDYDLDVPWFFCQCFYLESLRQILSEINFLEHALDCELVIVDMCNCVSPWIKHDIVDLFYLLGTNT